MRPFTLYTSLFSPLSCFIQYYMYLTSNDGINPLLLLAAHRQLLLYASIFHNCTLLRTFPRSIPNSHLLFSEIYIYFIHIFRSFRSCSSLLGELIFTRRHSARLVGGTPDTLAVVLSNLSMTKRYAPSHNGVYPPSHSSTVPTGGRCVAQPVALPSSPKAAPTSHIHIHIHIPHPRSPSRT